MTINFPVLSPVCSIFHFKVVAFCLNYDKIDVFGRIGADVCLDSIERGCG